MMEQQNTTVALEETAVQEMASHLRGALLRPGEVFWLFLTFGEQCLFAVKEQRARRG